MPAEALAHSTEFVEFAEEARAKMLASMTPAQVDKLLYDWDFWARPDQKIPTSRDWRYWAIIAGRGAGKTRTGSETVRQWARKYDLVNVVGATADDVRDVIVLGPSGILACCSKEERPRYVANQSTLHWPNGSRTLLFSAQEPDRFRGKSHSKLWFDELAAYPYLDEVWMQAIFGLRHGDNPQAMITTTPRPKAKLREIMEDPLTVLTRGSTLANLAHLPEAFRSEIIKKFEGTRIGRQEIYGELLEDVPGALWTQDVMTEVRRKRFIPEFSRVVVAVDPSGAGGDEKGDKKARDRENNRDEIGIIVAALGVDGRGYVLADKSCKLAPYRWAKTVTNAYHNFKADCVVAETNFGGAMVIDLIKSADPHVPVKEIHSSRGKVVRAEPIASYYAQGRVTHVEGSFNDKGVFVPEWPNDGSAKSRQHAALEDQMLQVCREGYLGRGSPDRVDATVFALAELMGGPEPMAFPKSWYRNRPVL